MCGTNQPLRMFSSFQLFLTPSRDNCRTSEGVELLSPRWVICEVSLVEKLKAPEDSTLRTCFSVVLPTEAHGADPAPRGHGLTRKPRSVEAEASAMMHTNFESACFVRRIGRIRPCGHPCQFECDVTREAPQPPSDY